ncbi:MAG TPA: hypothetical protein VGM19_13180 [Armatimonadota bacterium]|jgi:hypothetical protein
MNSFSTGVRAVLVAAIIGLALAATGAQAQPPPPPQWHPPVLAWAGTAGYVGNGVLPTSSRPGVNYQFKVKYSHPDGLVPQSVVVHIWLPSGVEMTGSPFAMTGSGSTTWVQGVIFTTLVKLTAAGNYKYSFVGDDGLNLAALPTSGKANGPLVNSPPVLKWTGAPGYESGGVAPLRGLPSTTFKFQIMFSDADGRAPKSVLLQVWNQAGSQILNSPFTMTATGNRWAKGVVFTQDVKLQALGTFSYRFSATDAFVTVDYPVAGRVSGPVVTKTP